MRIGLTGRPPTAERTRELRAGVRQVETWRQARQQGGAEALRSKGPHRRHRLDEAMFAALEAELNRGPAAHGYADEATEVWKREVWPQVEALRATWAPASVSRTRPVKGSG
jgi:hypothetical protein